MKVCSNCKKELSEDAKFCGNCGSAVIETVFCHNCGTQTSSEYDFCENCGSRIRENPKKENISQENIVKTPSAEDEIKEVASDIAEEEVSDTVEPTQGVVVEDATDSVAEEVTEDVAQNVVETTKASDVMIEDAVEVLPKENVDEKIKGKTKKAKKVITIISICIVIAIVLSTLAYFAFGFLNSKGSVDNDYLLYVKDQELFFSDLKKDSKPYQLTSMLYDEDKNEWSIRSLISPIADYTHMSDDGERLFFIDKLSDESGTNLYYKNVKEPESEKNKIDSYVTAYMVDNASNIITYLKGEEGDLYRYNISEDIKEKIASDVEEFWISEDETKIRYLTSEGSVYLKYIGADKEKIASDVSSIVSIDENLTTIYYIKEGTLYKQNEGEEAVKISSDVSSILEVYDSGELYYYKEYSTEKTLMEYVTDDLKASDDAFVMPSYPKRPSWWDYDTDAAYDSAMENYNRAKASYEVASDKQGEISQRNQLRHALKNEIYTRTTYSLCYFDGAEETVLTEHFNFGYDIAENNPVISYEVSNYNIGEIKLSEISSIYDVKEKINEREYDYYIAVRTTATLVEEITDIWGGYLNENGTEYYYIANVNDDGGYGEAYSISIDTVNGTIREPELYDVDVDKYESELIYDKTVYFKNVDDYNSSGDLYVEKEKIAFDVYTYHYEYDEDLNKILCLAEWNDDEEAGTLKIHQDGASTTIAEGVHDFCLAPDGRVFYLNDYSLNHEKGTLYEWINGESKKIDDDVYDIIPYSEIEYKWSYYFRIQ